MSIQVITVTGNISLTTSDSGNVYQLNVPSANSTISLPPPTNGFNATFIGNNDSSYTYSFSTPSGLIIQSITIGINLPITISNVNPTITVNGNIGKEYHVNSDGTNYTIIEINLNPTGITLGTYGSSTQVPQITFDRTGRAVQVSNIPIAFPSSSINVTGTDITMSGTTGTDITNATLVNTGVTAGTYGSSTNIPQITIDGKGRITSATDVAVSIPSNSINVTGTDITMSGTTGTNITNATLTNTGVTAGTYGSGATIPQITIDSKGRITSATPVGVAGSISVTGNDLTMSGTTGTAITNATLTNTGVTAGTYGSGTQIPQITVDTKGRITNITTVNNTPTIVMVSGSITITLSQNGSIFELNNPSANATITLPNPSAGFNVSFFGNESYIYTYTLQAPTGVNIFWQGNWNNTVKLNPIDPYTLNTAPLKGGYYYLFCDGYNYILTYQSNFISAPINSPVFSGTVKTGNNTLDDGSGNAIFGHNVTSYYIIANISMTTPSLNFTGKQYLNGITAGTVYYTQYFQGTFKAFVAQFVGYENNSTTNQTISFAPSFTYTPIITTNTTGLTITASTSSLTINAPNNTTIYNGIVEVKGF